MSLRRIYKALLIVVIQFNLFQVMLEYLIPKNITQAGVKSLNAYGRHKAKTNCGKR